MGSHVSATPNHQTGNITPIKFRFDMACAGRLGMELQPRQMTDEERQFARRAIASVFYGDMLCALRNQVAPYENEKALPIRW